MPPHRSPFTAFRLIFRWSNSSQTWKERVGDLALIAGLITASAITFLFDLEWWQTLLVWGCCLLPLLPLGYMGWLKLFGPVLYYDMIRQARRSRFIVLRFFYALLLVLLLFSVSLSYTNLGLARTNTNYAAEIAETYFDLFMVAQFATVVLLTPAYVAGAIADEKDRKTLEFMLATDLLNREIVLSKLGSRVANLALIVLTGMPILSILQFLGGVDPNLVLAGFAVTAVTVLGQAGVSILFSTLCKKPREAIVLSYLASLAYYAVALVGWMVVLRWPTEASTPILWGVSLNDGFGIFNKGNLIAFIVDVKTAGFRGTLNTDLPGLVGGYALFHGFFGLVCTLWAVARLRGIALGENQVKAFKGRSSRRLWPRPRIGASPMLWKEINCERGQRTPWVGRIIILILLLVTFGPVVAILWNYAARHLRFDSFSDLAESMNVWVRTANVVIGCLTLMAIAVRASTSITSERERQTFDTLLTTPLDSGSILFAKWYGSIISVRFGMLWLVLVWAAALVTGGLHWFALPWVALAWTIYAAFSASLGMWFSVVSRSSMRATVFTIMSMLGLGVGHWLIWMCCIPLVAFSTGFGSSRGAEYIPKVQLGVLTPPFVMGFLPFPSTIDLSRNRAGTFEGELLEFFGFCLGGMVTWSIGAAVLYALTSSRLRTLTHRDAVVLADATVWGTDPDSVRRRQRADKETGR